MLKHDKQRFQAFFTLAGSVDEADFFLRLQTAYEQVGIGTGLDFAGITSAWAQGAALPLEWRKALATQMPFDARGYQGDDTYGALDTIHRVLFVGAVTAGWIERGEWLTLLLAPLLSFYPLASVFVPRDHRSNSERYRKAESTLGSGLREWARQLEDGSGEWGAVSAWLRDAGADPSLLSRALAPGKEGLGAYQVDGLGALRLQLLLVREQLLLGALSRELSIDILLSCLHVQVDRSGAAKSLDIPLGALHQFSLPLLKELAGGPRLSQMLSAPKSYGYDILGRLLEDYSVSALFAADVEGYRGFLAQLSEQVLRWVKARGSFATLYPDAALILEQTQYQRLDDFTPQCTSAQALDWYQSLLGQLSGERFSKVLDQFKHSGDQARLHQVITQYLKPHEEQHDFRWELLDNLDNGEYLYSYLSGNNPTLAARAATQLFNLATIRLVGEKQNAERANAYAKHPQYWPLLMQASEAFAALFIEVLDEDIYRDDLARWELLWHAAQDEQRQKVAAVCMQTLSVKYIRTQLVTLIERLYAHSPQPFHAYIDGLDSWSASEQIGALAKQKTVLMQLVPRLAVRGLAGKEWARHLALDPKSASAIAAQTLVDYPQAFADLADKAQLRLLALFNDSSLVACGAALAKLFNSSSKTLRDPVLALLARSGAAAIEVSGLLTAAPKARKWVLTGMAMADDPAMAALLNRHLDDEAHDDYSRGLSLTVLERAGLAVAAHDERAGADLATLQKAAQGVKIPAAVNKYWNDEFASALAPLGEVLGRHLMFMLFDGGQQIPRSARQVLEFLPAGRRSDFAFVSVQQWIAANGAGELDWMLLTAPEFGDERVANALVKAVNDWKKLRKVKANAALRLLCQLPGDYGVFQARDLWENGKLSDAVLIAARQALSEAAAQRGMTLQELVEQLVPDFGLSAEGLVLDVGPYCYVVRMLADLSLLVFDENGKASKSLPKAKAGEDADKRSLAENHFKALSKNLKPLFKQQSRRLARLFQLGSAWPAATWQKLFIQHPLMAVIAQTVVWSANDGLGQPLQRFRPVEGGGLIGLDDDAYHLPANAIVHATHPLELEESERAAWAAHFKDYQLESPIEQWTTPVLTPAAEVLAADRLPLPARKKLNRGKLGSLLDKWGYVRAQAGDGARVCAHTWLLDGGRWRVTLNHGDVGVYFDADAKVSLQDIQVHRREVDGFAPQRLGELPPAFLNTLLHQAQTLSEHAL